MTNPLTKEEMDEIKARVNRGAAYPLEIRQCRALISALESAWTERDELKFVLGLEKGPVDSLTSQLAEERTRASGCGDCCKNAFV